MSRLEWKIPVVLHREFGSFALTSRMYEMLKTRAVPWLERFGAPSLEGLRYLPADGDDLRRDPDMVEVVQQLRSELELRCTELDSWEERRVLERDLLHGLEVTDVRVVLEIDDQDGRETVRVGGGLW